MDGRGESGLRATPRSMRDWALSVSHEDDDDVTVCSFDLKHKAEGVPAKRILHYGPDDFMPACAECAEFFEQTT